MYEREREPMSETEQGRLDGGKKRQKTRFPLRRSTVPKRDSLLPDSSRNEVEKEGAVMQPRCSVT